jgi:hypothetical protein
MKIGGWKTRSVFERYAIVSQSDIRDAMVKLEAGRERDNAEAAQEKKTAELQFVRLWAEMHPRALILAALPQQLSRRLTSRISNRAAWQKTELRVVQQEN